MYPVSEAFLQAVQENTRKYYWTGKIITKAGVEYPFGYEDIVKGSGYITAQCCGSTEIKLGTVYAAEMLSIYPENDIETYRDVLYFVAQVLGGFFCMRSSRERGQPAGKKLAEFHCTGGYSGDIHMPVSENIRKSNSGTAVYGTCGGCGTGRICHIPDV